MITLVTLATANYLPSIRPYLDTLQAHGGGVRRWLGGVGCDPRPALAGLPDIGAFHVPAGMLANTLGNPGNGCIQHGNFLPYLPGNDDDVIICTDGDVRMQRPLSDDERGWLTAWPEGLVGIGPNAGPADTLTDEARRIRPAVSLEELARRFYPDPTRPPLCGNAGVLVARRRTYERLWHAYLRLWLETASRFAHIAVQQWTINLAIEREFARAVLPLTFHAHGHYGQQAFPGLQGWGHGETTTYEGVVVWLKHRCW